MCIPSRDVDWEDCDFDGAYLRIAASWRSAEPIEASSPTVELGGEPFVTRLVVNGLALPHSEQGSPRLQINGVQSSHNRFADRSGAAGPAFSRDGTDNQPWFQRRHHDGRQSVSRLVESQSAVAQVSQRLDVRTTQQWIVRVTSHPLSLGLTRAAPGAPNAFRPASVRRSRTSPIEARTKLRSGFRVPVQVVDDRCHFG